MQNGGANGGAKPAALALATRLAQVDGIRVTAFIRSTFGEQLPFDGIKDLSTVAVDERFLHSQSWLFQPVEPWSIGRAHGCDVLFAPFGDPLLADPDLPVVSQRYDIQHVDHPEFFPLSELRHRAEIDRRMKLKSTHIITSSEHARSRIIESLEIDADRTSVIPLPVPKLPEPITKEELTETLGRLGLEGKRFIYYPANLWPHKNHLRLIEAFALVLQQVGSPIDLVLTGDTLDRASEIRQCAERLGIPDRVHMLGFVSDADRHAVWTACAALVFPSLYEGFGIPIQEALLYGKPIACSGAGSIPEVAGEAAVYFDATDIDDIARAILEVLVNDGLPIEHIGAYDNQIQKFAEGAIIDRLVEVLVASSASGTAHIPEPNSNSVDVIILGCDHRTKLERTFTSLELQKRLPGRIILAASSPIHPDDLARASNITECCPVIDDDDRALAEQVTNVLRRDQKDQLLFLRAGEYLFDTALETAAVALQRFPGTSVLHSPDITLADGARVLMAPAPPPVDPAVPATRRFVSRCGAFISASALPEDWALTSARYGFESLLAQVPQGGRFLYVPAVVAQSSVDDLDPLEDLRSLYSALIDAGSDEPGAWVLRLCADIIAAREAPERVLPPFRVIDRLLWSAPLMFSRAGIPFDDSTRRELGRSWRQARTGPNASLLANPLQDILGLDLRESKLQGLVGPNLSERVAKTFASGRKTSHLASKASFRKAILDSKEGDLHPALQDLLNRTDDRDFLVSAFEYTADRTPAPHEIADLLPIDSFNRVATLKSIILGSIEEDWKRVLAAALSRTPFRETATPAVVYPLASDRPTSADEWFARLKDVPQPSLTPSPLELPSTVSRAPRTEEPSVTILCSIYDGDAFIRPYLENLTQQKDFADFELVIVDACSPGSEYAVIAEYLGHFPNISYTRTDHRIGIYEAWNLALRGSSGRYITNANLDDSRHPESCARMRDALDEWRDVDVVYSDNYYTFIPHLAWDQVAAVGVRSHLPPPTRHNMLDFNSPHCAPMWRRGLHAQLGCFDESLKSAGDWEFWLRGIRSGITMRKIDEPLVMYFHNPRGVSTRVDSVGSREESRIRREYRDLLIEPDSHLDPRVLSGSALDRTPEGKPFNPPRSGSLWG